MSPSHAFASPPTRFSHHAQGVIWFRLEKGPLHLVADQYFKLEQLDGGDH